MKRSFFSQLWLRLKADTPSFFQKLIAFGLTLFTIGTTLSVIPGIPIVITTISAKLIWVGLAISGVAKAVVKNGDPIVYHDSSLTKEQAVEKANEP